jgi:hypothetical protein
MSTTLAPKAARKVAFPTDWAPSSDLSQLDVATIANKEEHRWVRWLGVAFVGSAILFAATIVTGSYWYLGGALAVGARPDDLQLHLPEPDLRLEHRDPDGPRRSHRVSD